MEYTKDIILDVSCKREIWLRKIKSWKSNVKKIIASNKLIVITLNLLVTLIVIDIVLVNSFLQLLSKLY